MRVLSPVVSSSVSVVTAILIATCAPLSAAASEPKTPEAGPDPSPPPRARQGRVALLDLFVDGGALPQHLRTRLDTALHDELARAKSTLIEGEPLGQTAAGCHERRCAGTAAQTSGASYAVLPHLAVDGPDYTFDVAIVGPDGNVASTLSDTCEVCGADELQGVVTEVAIRARKQLDAYNTAPPLFAVTSTPAGAVVTLDGEPIGETPLQVQVPAGEHDIVVAYEGYIKRRERLGFVDGVKEQLSVELEPLPDDITQDARDGRNPGRGLRIGGFTSLGLGVVGIAAGGAMFATDNREITSDCSGDNVDADGDCRYAWDTTPGAVALTVTGGALMVTGAVLLALGYKKRKQALALHPHVEPRMGGMALSF